MCWTKWGVGGEMGWGRLGRTCCIKSTLLPWKRNSVRARNQLGGPSSICMQRINFDKGAESRIKSLIYLAVENHYYPLPTLSSLTKHLNHTHTNKHDVLIFGFWYLFLDCFVLEVPTYLCGIITKTKICVT